jgi:cysteine-rich repeat protein
MPEIQGDLPEPYCRMDCKPIRCGDGVVDVGAGETCDEGEAMFKCNGFPQPACDCAIPSWGNPQYNTTCCPENQYCSVWPTETCPVNCGVGTGGRGGVCGNHQLDRGEECDVTAPGWQGEGSDWADAQVTYAYRPNRDGTDASFLAVDGNWKALPSSVEQLYTTVDHDPLVPGDNAWMYSARRGTAKTYFHLWDIPLTTATIFNRVDVVASVDFSELEPDAEWEVLRAPMTLLHNAVNGADMNAAVLAVVADETAHTLTFTLHHSVTRQALTRPVVMRSPAAVSGLSAIAVDAIHVETYGTSLDESYACNVDLCTLFRCGNRHEEPGETCDDGNNQSNDGCSNTCQLEFCALPD